MNDFLSSWYGILTIVLFDVVALIAVICITYRWLFKHIFDCLVAGICLVFTSPLFLAVLIRGKLFMKNHEGAIDSLTENYYRVGKKEKVVKLSYFRSRDRDGEVLGEYGKWIESWKLSYLPMLFDIFLGKMSFIGGKALLRSEAEFVETEEEKDRYLARPGVINPLVRRGDEKVTYEEMFLSDRQYAWNYSFFLDCKIFFTWLLRKIRVEDDFYMGETRKETYAEYLLRDDRITQEDFDAAKELDTTL